MVRMLRLAVVVAVVAAVWADQTARVSAARLAGFGIQVAVAAGRVVAGQAAGQAAGPSAARNAGGGPAFTFAHADEHGPVRWDPCTPIRWVANLSQAPAGAREALDGSFARLSAATGLRFVFAGETDALPGSDWSRRRFAGSRGWPPLIVAWARPGQTDLLDGTQAGVGTRARVPGPAGPVYVSGSAVFDASRAGDYRPGFGRGATLGGLVLHELGHVVGLSHVSDPQSMMTPRSSDGAGEVGPGDAAGLAALGAAGGCRPAPAPPWG